MLLVALTTAGLGAWTPAAQAADTGNAAPQSGKIVSDEPGQNAPNILDGTVYSIAKVGNTIVVGGQFTQAQNFNTSAVVTRNNVLAFDATTGKLLTSFAPNPNGTVYKVLPAADGQSVYVAGGFSSAAGVSTPGRLFKMNVTTGQLTPGFTAQTISGDIRDMDLVGNHLFIAGKFTHINGIAQKALGTVYADTGRRDPYFNAVFAGLHNPNKAGAVTNVLQISINKQNTELVAVGNFTSVDAVARRQIVKFDIGNTPTVVDATVHQTLSPWYTTLYQQACSSSFDTYMTDVEYSPDGTFFVVSTTGAYGGSGSLNGTSGCDVVARFEENTSSTATPTWTAYTGGDTTWTVEVTDNVVYAGGHQRWQNNPTAADQPGQGAVSREGIAALNTVNGMPYSWNPTRARGVGVQDMLATTEGLYVGSDTELIGHTPGNGYHARIAVLPLATGTRLPQLQTKALPTDIYRVATNASQLQKRAGFTGNNVAVSAATNAPTGPGWNTSTGAFMVNGVLYKTNSDGSLSKMTFDGTTYGSVSAVNTADALANQTDWHNDAKTLTSIFYSGGYMYYTKSGTNALYRRGFEVESGVVGQQRFSTTSSAVNWSNVRGAFVAGGKLFYANTNGQLFSLTWNQSAHGPVAGTSVQLTNAGTGWASRAMFPMEATPPPVNDPPVAGATVTCTLLQCSFDATATTDPEGGALTYDWDFGDGTAHGSGVTTTHTYDSAGDRAVTLIVTDDKGATNSVTMTASPTSDADPISFVNSNNNNGNRSTHTIAVPSGTQVGDTMLLFFTANSTSPVYTGPSGWTQVLTENSGSQIGKLYSKTATAGDLSSPNVTVLSRQSDGTTTYQVKSDLTIASYRGNGTPAIAASAVTSQNVANPVHTTPTVNASDGTKWLVSYWTDKGSTTTGWTGPTSQTQRAEGTMTGTSHPSSLLMDSNGRVTSGLQGGLNATADPNSSSQGMTMSLLLSSQGPPPANQNPTAKATLVGCNGLTCSFDGASSSDPEAGALTYEWNWGDGTSNGTGATASHTFANGVDTTVTLTVKDPQNATGSDTVTATPRTPPANAAPTARITGVSCTNLSCSFDGSSSSDPDTDTLTYSWNFGDGGSATTANPTHVYGSAGSRTVTLTVNDGHGHTATDTTTVSPTAAPNLAPTARITNVSCPNLTCSFSGATSSDPENDTLTYSWDFGDGSTGTGATPSHAYANTTTRTVTLTVNDGHGNTASTTAQATPTAAPATNITFVGSTTKVGNRTTHSVTLPAGVQTGDTMVLFFGSASITPTYVGPNGWTEIENKNGSSAMAVRVYTKTATASDTAGSTVSISSGTVAAKADTTVAVYRGTDGTTPIAVSASKIDNSAGASHTSPVVTASDSTSWLLSYFADRSNTTTAWSTTPAGMTVRNPGTATDTGSAHTIGLFGDSNGPVAAGSQGGLTAVANGDSSRGASVSILLKRG